MDPRAAGYHAIQSRVAIGSGGWFGTGYTEGPQKRLAFLPEQHTDFVFPIVGEELGFVGVLVALALFLALFLVLLRIARRATDSFSSLADLRDHGPLFTHVYENIGMTVNLMPITGIPLPFFSYGGLLLRDLLSVSGIGVPGGERHQAVGVSGRYGSGHPESVSDEGSSHRLGQPWEDPSLRSG